MTQAKGLRLVSATLCPDQEERPRETDVKHRANLCTVLQAQWDQH